MIDPGRRDEEGMILINVLLFVALAASVVAIMIVSQDIAMTRTTRMREAAQALAIAEGGELSAITALRRDAIESPEADYPGEPWGAVREAGARIEGGTFDLAIADAQSRLNVNSLRGGDALSVSLLLRIATAVRLPADLALRAAALIRLAGPIDDLSALPLSGIDPATLARLSGLLTAIPGESGRINLNSVGEDLLGILLDDPAAAHRLIAVRDRQGFLRPEDFAAAGMLQPPGTGFTSDTYWIRARVQIGDARQQVTTLLVRKRDAAGVAVVPVARWRGPNPPAQAPPLPFVRGGGGG